MAFLSMKLFCRRRLFHQVVVLVAFSSCLVYTLCNASALDAESHTGSFPVPAAWPSARNDSGDSQREFVKDEENNHSDNDTFRPTQKTAATETRNTKSRSIDFIEWCKTAMGIETLLEIQTFDYYDYTKELASRDLLVEWDNDDSFISSSSPKEATLPLLSVRGLAASRDISVGEVVIEIPLLSLLSVPTTIDRDPVLSKLMGPSARERHGWFIASTGRSKQFLDDVPDPEIFSLHELALLAVALLYHKSLREESPLDQYVGVLKATPVDSMPFLWPRDKIQQSPLFLHDGIRSVAIGLRRDIRDMYKSVVLVLLREHPEVFTKEMLSFTEFEWAFAIVNSRHWQLHIDDLISDHHTGDSHKHSRPQVSVEDQLPPAETPTDSWVLEHEDVDEDDNLDDVQTELEEDEHYFPKIVKASSKKHSFVAPVADLLNFGPPCTRGHYNTETKTFQIISTCPFRKGQEVTFWYSDKCDHVMIGMYGFTHPMIPRCPSVEEYRSQLDEAKRTIGVFDDVLDDAYRELEQTSSALDRAEDTLAGCGDCCEYVSAPRSEAQASSGSVRGSHPQAGPIAGRRRVRMNRETRDEEF